jgi:hypothetical protein
MIKLELEKIVYYIWDIEKTCCGNMREALYDGTIQVHAQPDDLYLHTGGLTKTATVKTCPYCGTPVQLESEVKDAEEEETVSNGSAK